MSDIKKICIAALGAICVAALGAALWTIASEGAAARAEEEEGGISLLSASLEEGGGISLLSASLEEGGDCGISLLSTPLEESGEICESCGGSLYVATVDPTCLAEGFTAYYCPSCDEWERRDVVEAAGHSYEERVVDPTCTSYGYTVHTCSVCGASFRDSIIPNLGHDYSSSVLYPTCEYDGGVVYTCSRCGDSYMDEDTRVAASGHSFAVATYEPGCTECGYLYERCSSCGAVNLLETLDPLGHDFETERVAGTEDSLGYTIYRCSRCNFVEIGEIGAAHRFEAAETVEPTCESEGYTVYVCQDPDCGETYKGDIVPALGHDYAVRNFSMNRAVFTAVVYCSRCGLDAGEDVTISVFSSNGTASAKGAQIDISSLSGVADISIFAGGTRIFYLSGIDIDGLEDEVYEGVAGATVSVTEEGLLSISYVVDGKERADTLTLYLVCDGRMAVAYPSGGEVNLGKFGFSGEVTIYAVTSSGSVVYEGSADASGFVYAEDEDEDDWDDEDDYWDEDEGPDEDPDEGEGDTAGAAGGDEETSDGEKSGAIYSATDDEGNCLTVFVDSEGVATFSYLSPEGEDLGDELFVYLVSGDDFALVAAPEEIDFRDYGVSGEVTVSVFGREGRELAEFSVFVSEDASLEADDSTPADGSDASDAADEDEDEGTGSSGAGVIVAAVIVILLIVALVAYFVWSRLKKKKAGDKGDGKKKKEKTQDEDVFSGDDERDSEDIDDIEDVEDEEEEEDDENGSDGGDAEEINYKEDE